MILRYSFVFNDFVKILNELKIVFELTSLACVLIFIDLDSFVIRKLRILGAHLTLVLNLLNDFLLLNSLHITWVDKLNVVSLIEKVKLLASLFFLLIIINVQLNILNLNLLIEQLYLLIADGPLNRKIIFLIRITFIFINLVVLQLISVWYSDLDN